MTYADELLKAKERTSRFGLRSPKFELSSQRFLSQQKKSEFPYAVFEAVGELNVDEVVAQCFSIHYRLKAPLEKFFQQKMIYTVGYVSIDHETMFYQSESDLQYLLDNGMSSPKINLHAWLSLPSCEIIDVSLPTSIAVIKGLTEGKGGVIASHADELINGARYHPMLLGEDYFRKIGVFIEFNTYGS